MGSRRKPAALRKKNRGGDMSAVGLDHLVVNTKDVESAAKFYRDVLGMEILRLEEEH